MLSHDKPPECLFFQLTVSQDRLQQCLTHLGCSLMERERRSFLLYSQFYEQILQQETQLLCQREQVRVRKTHCTCRQVFLVTRDHCQCIAF